MIKRYILIIFLVHVRLVFLFFCSQVVWLLSCLAERICADLTGYTTCTQVSYQTNVYGSHIATEGFGESSSAFWTIQSDSFRA